MLSVDLFGGVENEVQVMVDPERLEFYGLGLVDVQDAIALQNLTIPGGKLSLGQFDYKVRVPGEVDQVDEILDFVVNPGVSPPVYIRDVATVSFGIQDRETISRVNGQDAVTCRSRSAPARTSSTSRRRCAPPSTGWHPRSPPAPRSASWATSPRRSATMVHELENNIISGLILVVAVLFLFLGFTNSLFVGVAIPFSMLITFIALRAFGITLNMVVALQPHPGAGHAGGQRHRDRREHLPPSRHGKTADDAARDGAHQVSAAVIASTLTTVCAFGPLAFWPGIMGGFMKFLPITVVITLVASLLVALVFNPVLCARFLRTPRPGGGSTRLGDALMGFGLRTYQPTLLWALRHKAVTLAGW